MGSVTCIIGHSLPMQPKNKQPKLQNIVRFIIRLSSKFIVRSTYDSDLKCAKISLNEYCIANYEHHLRGSYNVCK